MPVNPTYPGVYIQEISSGVRTITGVSTSTAMFVGMASRGRLDVPTLVLSFSDFQRAFGTDPAISEMTDQVRLFFQNGGQRAYIMRIAKDAKAARATVGNEFGAPTVTFTAKEAGVIGDSIRLEVDYNTARPEAMFNLRVFRASVSSGGDVVFVETETHNDLSMDPSAGRFIESVLERHSSLVSAAIVPTPPGLLKGYAIPGVLLNAADDLSRLNAAITTVNPIGNIGRFEVSVDGRAFVTVPLQAPVADATAIQTAINMALAPTGTQVTVSTSKEVAPGGPAYLVIMSTSDGGDVRLRRAVSHDIAGMLGMGHDDGGLEVHGYAARRPAQTGFFSRLGPLDVETDPTALNALSSFLQSSGTDLATITVVDSVNGSNNATPTYAGSQMWDGTATSASESLLNGGQNLDAIAGALDTVPAIAWTPRRYGYRLVLIPRFGGADTDLAADVTSAPINAVGTGIFAANPNVARNRLGGYGALGGYVTGDQGGYDGDIPQLQDYTKAFDIIDRRVDLFNLLLLPRILTAPGQTDDDRAALWGPASTFCLARRAFLLMDPRADWTTAQDVFAGVSNLRKGLVKDHAAVYWPRLRIVDPATGAPRLLDPSGSIAGLMARTDANRGVWKAPAGIQADLRGLRGLEHSLSDPENGLINPQAINAIRVFSSGIVSWGARTMDGFDNSGNLDYRYVPVRRLALFIEESLYRGLKFAVFEPNDEPLWAQIRLAAGAFMSNLFRQGAFQGQKASDAYFVKVDSETTTQNDINLGIVNVIVGFAALKPAEFVVITIQQKAGEVQT